MIQNYTNNLCTEFEPRVTSSQNNVFYENMAVVSDIINSKPIFPNNFGKQQPACQIWCSRDLV